jgi:hypothetical protein
MYWRHGRHTVVVRDIHLGPVTRLRLCIPTIRTDKQHKQENETPAESSLVVDFHSPWANISPYLTRGFSCKLDEGMSFLRYILTTYLRQACN